MDFSFAQEEHTVGEIKCFLTVMGYVDDGFFAVTEATAEVTD